MSCTLPCRHLQLSHRWPELPADLGRTAIAWPCVEPARHVYDYSTGNREAMAENGIGRPWMVMAGLGRPWPVMTGHGGSWP